MPYTKIGNAIVCDVAECRNYLCYEHTTYLFEFSPMFGPAWFTVPGDQPVDVEPDGHLSFLWDFFESWYDEERTNDAAV